MKNIKRFMPLAALGLMLGFTACQEESYVLDSASLMYSIEIDMAVEQKAKIYIDATETETLPMYVGESIQLGFVSDPADLSTLTYPEIKWVSSDESVVTVDASGKLTAKAPGFAVISVSPSTVNIPATSSLKVTVVSEVTKVTSISISDNSEHESDFAPGLPSCYIGETLTLSAVVSPAEATYQSVLWTSLDESKAVVDPITGVVTGVAQGEVEIKATALDEDKVSKTYKVYVDKVIMPEGIKVNNAPASDEVFSIGDGYYQVDFETYPTISTRSKITWTSSNTEVATVDTKGKVTFLKYGTADITATVPETEADHEGFVKTITMKFNIPAGFYREHFADQNIISWFMATSGGTYEWKMGDLNEAYIWFTPNKANANTLRGDFKRQAPTYLTQDYPILCFRFDDVNDLTEKYARAINLDTSGNMEDGTKYSGNLGGSNQKWKKKYKCSDGSSIIYYDLSTQGFGKTDGTNLLPAGSVGTFSTFQIKYADIRYPDKHDYPADWDVHYRFFWFHTFKSEAEMTTYLNAWSTETGITFE
jgi:uncharacterized protein YjdB